MTEPVTLCDSCGEAIRGDEWIEVPADQIPEDEPSKLECPRCGHRMDVRWSLPGAASVPPGHVAYVHGRLGLLLVRLLPHLLPAVEGAPTRNDRRATVSADPFMRAVGRRERGEPDPPGAAPCVLCGFPCERDQTIFVVPVEFQRFSRYPAVEGRTPTAHESCAFTMYRGRYDALRRWIEEGMDHAEMLERVKVWPYTPEEVAMNEDGR